MDSVMISENCVNAAKTPTSAKLSAICELLSFVQSLADEVADEGHDEECECDFCIGHRHSPNPLQRECQALAWSMDSLRASFSANLIYDVPFHSPADPTVLLQIATTIRKARKMEGK